MADVEQVDHIFLNIKRINHPIISGSQSKIGASRQAVM